MEVWKTLKYEGFGRYQISNLGRIRNDKSLMKPRVNTRGYMIIGLRNKTAKQKMFSMHRLVAEHFIENTYNKEQVNHKDGKKINNIVDNLEWVTSKENMVHAFEKGLCKVDEKHLKLLRRICSIKSRPIKCVDLLEGTEKEYLSINNCSKEMKICSKTINKSIKNKCVVKNRYIFTTLEVVRP